jgi:Holliday junction DNA helicase RuvA
VIGLVRGRVVVRGRDHLLIDTGGVGYRVYVPSALLASPQEELMLHTHLVVREDDLSLYGFATQAELELFTMLLSVGGVGPRVALSVLSALRPAEVYRAIREEDVGRLVQVPGIGKKTAERILVELRDKVGPQDLPPDQVDEALEALLALGVRSHEAARLLEDVEGSTEERIRIALQRLGGERA